MASRDTIQMALRAAQPPWLYVENDRAIDETVGWIRGAGIRVVALDCKIMTTLDHFFEEMARALEFPDYFGRNWPAFNECLVDLGERFTDQAIVIAFFNSGELLARDPSDRPTLVRIMEKSAAQLAAPVKEGEWWDRPEVAFHVLFDAESLKWVGARLARLG